MSNEKIVPAKAKKDQRFGKSRGQVNKLQFGANSQKSNMLQAMSDVASMKGDELDQMTVQDAMEGKSNWKPGQFD